MKSGALSLLVAVVALAIGIAVGGLGPRSELRDVRAKLEELEKRECRSGVGPDIAKMFQGRPFGGDRPDPIPKPIRTPVEDPDTDEDEPSFNITFNGGGDDRPTEDPEKAMAMARDTMDLRFKAAMAALEQDAQPTDQQLEDFESAMGRMNDDLLDLAGELKAQIDSGEEPQRRDMMVFAAETLDVLINAEDDLKGTFTESQLADMQEESLDPTSYIDPALIDVFAGLNP